MTDSRLSPAACRSLPTNSSICFSGTIVLLVTLPASPGATATGAATPEPTEPAASSTAAKAASTPSAPAPAAAREQHPEQQGPAKRRGDQKQEDDDADDPDCKRKLLRLIFVTRGRARGLRVCKLNSRVLGNDVGDTGCDQRYRTVVVSLLEKRECFTPETADFAVGKNALEAVTDGGPVLAILDRVKNEDAPIASLLSDSPLLVEL